MPAVSEIIGICGGGLCLLYESLCWSRLAFVLSVLNRHRSPTNWCLYASTKSDEAPMATSLKALAVDTVLREIITVGDSILRS